MINQLSLIVGILGLIVAIIQLLNGLGENKAKIVFVLSISTAIVCALVFSFVKPDVNTGAYTTPTSSSIYNTESTTDRDTKAEVSTTNTGISSESSQIQTDTAIPETKPSEPSQTKASITPTPEVAENYLNIKVNGVQKNYFLYQNSIELNNIDGTNKWYLDFNSNKFNNKDSISINLPANIANGDTLEAKPYNAMGNNGWLNTPDLSWGFFYTSINGNLYFLDSVSDGKITIKISKWEGRGGYAEGSIEGEFILNQVDKITFEAGEFKVRIAEKNY